MRHYLHAVPGRIRVKSPSLRRNEREVVDVCREIEALTGVGRAEANPLTGSVTVTYDPARCGEREILETLRRRGHYDAGRRITNDQYVSSAVTRGTEAIGKAIVGTLVQSALERSALSLIAAIL